MQCCSCTCSSSDIFLTSCHHSQKIFSKLQILCLLPQNLKFSIQQSTSPDTWPRESSAYEHQETSKICSGYPYILYKTIHQYQEPSGSRISIKPLLKSKWLHMHETYQEEYLHPRITENPGKERGSRDGILRCTQLVSERETTWRALGGSIQSCTRKQEQMRSSSEAKRRKWRIIKWEKIHCMDTKKRNHQLEKFCQYINVRPLPIELRYTKTHLKSLTTTSLGELNLKIFKIFNISNYTHTHTLKQTSLWRYLQTALKALIKTLLVHDRKQRKHHILEQP